MWALRKLSEEKVVYILPEKKNFTVGRTGVDLILKDDPSISRAHATFTLEKGVLQITDNNSKYGTYVNEGIQCKKPIDKEKVILKKKDRIRFGLINNVYKLDKVTIACLGSSLDVEETRELIHIISQFGGKFLVNITNECTHLTMTQATVTLKFLYALVYEVPIVTLDYWKAYLKALRSPDQNLPDPCDYTPKTSDYCKDLNIRPERRNLFEGFTFIFLNGKQFSMYNNIIQKIGGTCKNLSNGVQKALLVKPNVVVIQYIPITQSQSSQTINIIGDILKKNNKRLVPEYEIGLAIVNCSMKKFCNPDENAFRNLSSTKAKETEKSTNGETIFVENSIPNESSRASLEEDFVVAETDETYPNSNESKTAGQSSTLCETQSNSNKRSRALRSSNIEGDDEIESIDSDEEKTSKKLRTEQTIEESTSPQPSSSRSLRNKNLSHFKTEIAIINKTKPKNTNQNSANTNNEESSLNPKQKKSTLSSIDLLSSSEDGSLQKTSIKKNTTATSSSNVEIDTVSKKNPKKRYQRIWVESSSAEEDSVRETKRKRNGDIDEEDLLNSPKKLYIQDKVNDFEKHSSEETPSSSTYNSWKDSTQISIDSSQQSKSPIQRITNKTPHKPSPRPLPLTTKKKTTTINIADFTDLSQKVPIATSTQKQETNLDASKKDSSTESSRKRFYIPVIGSDDDDDDNDDNLFKFVGDEKKKPRLQNRNNDDDDVDKDSDEELFAFTENKSDKNEDDFPSGSAEKLNSNNSKKATDEPSFQLPKPKPLPSKINISDWLSCSGIKKEETSVDQQENIKKTENAAHTDDGDSLDEETKVKKEWLDSIKSGFKVRFCNLSISSHLIDEEKADMSSNSSNPDLNKNVRNFKIFVKSNKLAALTTEELTKPESDEDPLAEERLGVVREVGSQAVWCLSSCKPGFGVERLRDNILDTYWQSDGQLPHLVNIQFHKKTNISSVYIYTDYKLDESYTPSRISIRSGTHFNDLQELHVIELQEPSGWVQIPIRDADAKYIRTFMLQIAVISNHQNGRDTHMRQIRIHAPVEERNYPLEMFGKYTTVNFQKFATIR